MINQKRNKLLTEMLGMCWHDEIVRTYVQDSEHLGGEYQTNQCTKCKKENQYSKELYRSDFTSWDDFGMLWNYAIKQKWWNDFLIQSKLAYEDSEQSERFIRYSSKIFSIINPDKFADELYGFLKDKKNL